MLDTIMENSLVDIKKIKDIIKNGENTTVEFKAARKGLPINIFETICAFLT